MRKLFVMVLAAIMIFTMQAFAAQANEPAEDAAAEETVPEDTVQTDAGEGQTEEATVQISGLYIVNYAQAAEQVNLNIIAEPDLVAVAEQAGTVIYNFCDDGTVMIYADGNISAGLYTAEDGLLSITVGAETTEYTYEFIDGLLIIRNREESSILYDFVLDDMNYITIEDYSTLEIAETAVNITDEDVEAYINTVLQGQTTYDQVTEGITKDGDIITIAFEGILEGGRSGESGSAFGRAEKVRKKTFNELGIFLYQRYCEILGTGFL